MNPIIQQLNIRRERLGMSQARLAELTGVSLPTMQRFFSGAGANTSFETVCKIASSLGVTLEINHKEDERALLTAKAREKAQHMAALVQETFASGNRKLNTESLTFLEKKFFKELLTGPRSKIWND